MKKRPNILFIMTDQQRYDTFSMNNPYIKTPFMDKLISDSVFFENAYCTNPSCIPSRAAIMTGKFPSECQAPHFITYLPDNETTFMTRLQEADYYTAVIGKQHFAETHIKKGFDYENIIDCHFATAKEDTEKYVEYLVKNGVNPKDTIIWDLISGGHWNTEVEHHIDHFIGELGKEWLSKTLSEDQDKPWFFTLSFPGPHHPYDLEGTSYADQYSLDDIKLSESTFEDLDTKPKQYKEMDGYAHIYLKDFTEEQFKKSKRGYYANMTLIDEKVGELVQLLKDSGEYEDTLIIYTTDHGDFMGDYGLVEKLQCLADSLMRVPLFVKPPVKDFKGSIIKDYVSNIDIASTCLTAAEAKITDNLSDYGYNCYWDDALPMRKRDHVYMEAGAIRGILKDGIKTVHYMNRDYGELYDLNNDPLERVNLWDSDQFIKERLEAYRIMMNYVYRATPKWDTLWNHGTPVV